MVLPAAPAWLIDFATARSIFAASQPLIQSKITMMCSAGTLKFCGYEIEDFKNSDELKKHFIVDQDCRCNLDSDIVRAAGAFPNSFAGKPHHPKDKIAKMIVACAIIRGYAIVSGKSGMFVTPVELGKAHNIVCLTIDQFLPLI